jgi:hypothetical protein
VNPLTKELLVWIATRCRTYEQTMEAWRSNCPRHSVWEDASIDGLVEVVEGKVILTSQGRSLIEGKPE